MRRPRTQQKTPQSSHFFSTLFILLPLAAVFLYGAPCAAVTWYIKPSTEVPIRSGQGSDFKILAVVPDGMTVELLEENNPWAKIRTAGGTEGWLLRRYLTNDPPLTNLVASLQTQKTKLEGTSDEISRKFNELSLAHAQSEEQLNACRTERDESRQNYETLKQDTTDVIGIRNSLTEKTRELLDIKQKLTVLEQERNSLKKNTSLMWFLAGGFVLLSGWLLGMMTSRSKKRKASLY